MAWFLCFYDFIVFLLHFTFSHAPSKELQVTVCLCVLREKHLVGKCHISMIRHSNFFLDVTGPTETRASQLRAVGFGHANSLFINYASCPYNVVFVASAVGGFSEEQRSICAENPNHTRTSTCWQPGSATA